MEDVKKIARKFVSDSLAEKIAEFVAKASEQLVANVSEENDQNVDDVQTLSNEDQLQNIGRQRIQKGTKTTQSTGQDHTKYVEFEKEHEKEETTSKVNKEVSNAGQVINWEKEANEMAYDAKYSKEAQDKSKNVEQREADYGQPNNDFKSKPDRDHSAQDSEQQKLDYKQPTLDYEQQNPDKKKQTPDPKKPNLYSEWKKIEYEKDPDQEKPDHEKQKPDYELTKPVNEKPKTARKPKSHTLNQKSAVKELRRPSAVADPRPNKPRSTIKPAIDYTILYHKALRNGSPNSKGSAKRGHRLTGFNSQESFNQTTQPALQGFNIPKSLTTEKERVEFDQYDNSNYPKSEFIATSGPVALPKVPMKKPWWEVEMANR